jgi:hypothetical protein
MQLATIKAYTTNAIKSYILLLHAHGIAATSTVSILIACSSTPCEAVFSLVGTVRRGGRTRLCTDQWWGLRFRFASATTARARSGRHMVGVVDGPVFGPDPLMVGDDAPVAQHANPVQIRSDLNASPDYRRVHRVIVCRLDARSDRAAAAAKTASPPPAGERHAFRGTLGAKVIICKRADPPGGQRSWWNGFMTIWRHRFCEAGRSCHRLISTVRCRDG